MPATTFPPRGTDPWDDALKSWLDENIGKIINVRGQAYDADPTGASDASVAIQAAINEQQLNGGVVYIPPGVYRIDTQLVPAPGQAAGATWTDATRPLRIMGAGADLTVLRGNGPFTYNGLLGYGTSGVSPVCAQVVCTDLTFDGNYSGAGGTVPLDSPNAGALVSLPWPFKAATASTRNGQYHIFERCCFYRPPGFTFQPTQGVKLIGCEFNKVGQPGQAVVNWDCLGSGPGDAIVLGCTWRDSSGNYADFVSATPGEFIRLIMQGCESFNHAIGGIYACGQGSVIAFNSLHNNSTGSGIGYDDATHADNRSKNIVIGNQLTNLTVLASGLAADTHDDLIGWNIAFDTIGRQGRISGAMEAPGGVAFPASGNIGITPGAGAAVWGDGTNVFAASNGAGAIYLRQGGQGTNNKMIAAANGGLCFWDAGGTQRATIFSVSGAPPNDLGQVGDFAFRTDTPATANQRLYAKTGAATWTGIL